MNIKKDKIAKRIMGNYKRSLLLPTTVLRPFTLIPSYSFVSVTNARLPTATPSGHFPFRKRLTPNPCRTGGLKADRNTIKKHLQKLVAFGRLVKHGKERGTYDSPY